MRQGRVKYEVTPAMREEFQAGLDPDRAYCELCDHAPLDSAPDDETRRVWAAWPATHKNGDHAPGIGYPDVRLSGVDTAVSLARCWCGWPSASEGRCSEEHDPYGVYQCECGLHLFADRKRVPPGAWAWHLQHIAAFQARIAAETAPMSWESARAVLVAALGRSDDRDGGSLTRRNVLKRTPRDAGFFAGQGGDECGGAGEAHG